MPSCALLIFIKLGLCCWIWVQQSQDFFTCSDSDMCDAGYPLWPCAYYIQVIRFMSHCGLEISMCSKADKNKNSENLKTICEIDVITAAPMKISVSKDMTLCSLVDMYLSTKQHNVTSQKTVNNLYTIHSPLHVTISTL